MSTSNKSLTSAANIISTLAICVGILFEMQACCLILISLTSTMNNTTLGDAPLPTFSANTFLVVPNLVSLMVRFPVSVYIIQLIVSRQRITAEFYTLNEVIFELLIGVYYLLGVATFFPACKSLNLARLFFVGFITAGRPSVLVLICVDRYLAVVKPVLFLSLFLSLVVIPSRLRVQSGLWERASSASLSSTWGEERHGKLLGILRTPSSAPDILSLSSVTEEDAMPRVFHITSRILGRFLTLSFLKDEAAQWTCVLKTGFAMSTEKDTEKEQQKQRVKKGGDLLLLRRESKRRKHRKRLILGDRKSE
ncbi:hypothetical protein GBF38_003494 [Nibea albiflora]|uniref:Uncharacterized protein n=1 Tax=Nibea albiflora TaxID=240163 RepID=A0ACB7FKK6_NIBAL|nr:hypothetical protein GBF38_003494 [Nibea albiflora]